MLRNDAEDKTIWMLGSIKGDLVNKALLQLKKTEFQEKQLESLGSETSALLSAEKFFNNNEFYKFHTELKPPVSTITAQIIYPASEKLITKYSYQEKVSVIETADLYHKVVKPHYIDPMDLSHCNWIYSILDGVKEQENVLYTDDDFMLMKNYTYIEGDIRTIYALALPRERVTLKTVRDLTADHLPLLKKMRDTGYATIETKYGVSRDLIQAYFHYHPTYYHLHVHFTHIEGAQILASYVMLEEAIANIEMIPDYYQRATMVYPAGKMMPLYQII